MFEVSREGRASKSFRIHIELALEKIHRRSKTSKKSTNKKTS